MFRFEGKRLRKSRAEEICSEKMVDAELENPKEQDAGKIPKPVPFDDEQPTPLQTLPPETQFHVNTTSSSSEETDSDEIPLINLTRKRKLRPEQRCSSTPPTRSKIPVKSPLPALKSFPLCVSARTRAQARKQVYPPSHPLKQKEPILIISEDDESEESEKEKEEVEEKAEAEEVEEEVEAEETEDESDEPEPKRHKKERFQKAKFHRGKLLDEEQLLEGDKKQFLRLIEIQNWKKLFCDHKLVCDKDAVVEFYSNCVVKGKVIISSVKGLQVELDAQRIGELLRIPAFGQDMYERFEITNAFGKQELLKVVREVAQDKRIKAVRKVKKNEMKPLYQISFWFIIRNILPRGQRRTEADVRDMVFMHEFTHGNQINLPLLMIKHIKRIVHGSKPHDLVYGFLLTSMMKQLGARLSKAKQPIKIDFLEARTLRSCGLDDDSEAKTDEEKPEQKKKKMKAEEEGTSRKNKSENISAEVLMLKTENEALRAAMKLEREASNK